MTGYSFSTPVWDGGTWVTPAVAEVAAARKVNGPEDLPRSMGRLGSVDWRHHEEQVRRLRQQDLQGGAGGGLAQVRNLQKLMLRSRSNTLIIL